MLLLFIMNGPKASPKCANLKYDQSDLTMISVQEARQLILQNSGHAKPASVSLAEANGCILSADVFALSDTPPFDQSAMDGYSFAFDSWDGKSELAIAGEIPAGKFSTDRLLPLEAIRIFTGARLPAGADTVVIQEKVIATGKTININDEGLVKGKNVRFRGSQTKKGELAMIAGQFISPAAISFLASMGIDKVNVFPKPTVSIIVTGNELTVPGVPLAEGKIYESNGAGLVAALNQLRISPVSIAIVDDEMAAIEKKIQKASKSDIIIMTGGIAVGDHDHVEKALENCGAQKIFHNVKQKPGKPFYFGMIKDTMVFALPGNPAAVLTCFYEFIVPVISRFTKQQYFEKRVMPLGEEQKKRPGYTYFLKGKTNDDTVSVLPDQESYKMNSFAIADCLIELEAEKEWYKKGEMVSINMII